jgi:hypothetical protein
MTRVTEANDIIKQMSILPRGRTIIYHIGNLAADSMPPLTGRLSDEQAKRIEKYKKVRDFAWQLYISGKAELKIHL